MTTPPRIIPTTCKECSTFAGPFWNGFCPSCLDDFCGNGDGERVGLFAVREDEIDDVCLFVRQHSQEHPEYVDDCMLCALQSDVCTECDIPEEMMGPEDDEAHLIVDGRILVACEGYHTSFFRLANQELEN